MRTRTAIAALIYPMVNAVLFGSFAVAVLSIPPLQPVLEWAMPAAIVLGLALAGPIAWVLAPRLRARYWRGRDIENAPLNERVVDELAL